MSKKKPSPGTDAKELLLAKMLQNAHARGLKWTRSASLRDVNDMPIPMERVEEATCCCAVGAAGLEPDSEAMLNPTWGITDGNDSYESHWSCPRTYMAVGETDDEDVGHAFKVAMTEDE